MLVRVLYSKSRHFKLNIIGLYSTAPPVAASSGAYLQLYSHSLAPSLAGFRRLGHFATSPLRHFATAALRQSGGVWITVTICHGLGGNMILMSCGTQVIARVLLWRGDDGGESDKKKKHIYPDSR